MKYIEIVPKTPIDDYEIRTKPCRRENLFKNLELLKENNRNTSQRDLFFQLFVVCIKVNNNVN